MVLVGLGCHCIVLCQCTVTNYYKYSKKNITLGAWQLCMFPAYPLIYFCNLLVFNEYFAYASKVDCKISNTYYNDTNEKKRINILVVNTSLSLQA